jgi:alpha-L-fucosidase 2
LGFAISGKPPPKKPNPKDPYRPNPPPKVSAGARGVTLSEQSLLAGGGYSVAYTDTAEVLAASSSGDGGGRTLFVSVGAVKDAVGDSSEEAASAVNAAAAAAAADLAAEHVAWWHTFYAGGAFVSVPQTWLEGFYYIQMYKLGSATRPGGNVIDLLGPWNFSPTAWADIHWDLNVQLTYLPLLPSAHLDLHTSLEKFIASPATRKGFAANVPKQYQKDSWAAPASASAPDALSTCYWSYVSPGCQVVPGAHKGAIVGNLLWVAHNLWLQYRYTMDKQTLRDVVYPTLHRAVAYYEHLIAGGGKGGGGRRNKGGGGDGKVQLPAMASPEYKTNGPNTNYDLALLKWALQVLLDVHAGDADAAGAGEPLDPPPKAEAWKQTLASLPFYPRDAKTGYNVAQGVPLKEAHRHFSHLLMIYPLALESWEDEQARHLIEKSVDHWAGLCGAGACAGYSHTAASIMSSMMGRSHAALGNITRLLLEREDGFFPASVTRAAAGAAAADDGGGGGGKRKKGGMGPILGPNTMYGER